METTIDLICKISTVILIGIATYFAYKYNNNIKNMRITNIRKTKEQYYHRLLECCIKNSSYTKKKDEIINNSLEAIKYRMEFCVEISRLPLYASKEIVEYFNNCENGRKVLDLSHLYSLILRDLKENPDNMSNLYKESDLKKFSTAMSPDIVIVTINGKKKVKKYQSNN